MEGNTASYSWTVTHVPAGFSLESEIRRSTLLFPTVEQRCETSTRPYKKLSTSPLRTQLLP